MTLPRYFNLEEFQTFNKNNEDYLNNLPLLLQAAREKRLMSKYANLIAANEENFAYWYKFKVSDDEINKYTILYALCAIKANYQIGQKITYWPLLPIMQIKQLYQTILADQEVTESDVAQHKEQHMLFTGSMYHWDIYDHIYPNDNINEFNNLKERFYHFFIAEVPLYSKVSVEHKKYVINEIIDVSITHYENRQHILTYYRTMQKKLSNGIWLQQNYWRNLNLFLYKAKNLGYLTSYIKIIKRKLFWLDNLADINFLFNLNWLIRGSPHVREYQIIVSDDLPYGNSINDKVKNTVSLYGIDRQQSHEIMPIL